MKLLHSADWHLDAPVSGYPGLKEALRELPFRVVQAARETGCELILLAGDLFDGPYTRDSYLAVYRALEEAGMPVLISPGNHDPYLEDAPWAREPWPDNVHIFSESEPRSLSIPWLDCRVYGGAFRGSECGSLLRDFRAEGEERYCIGLFHGDPTVLASPYNPVTAAQIENSALDYLALGHIHKAGQLRRGSTLCAWPGCPMGRGYDETGEKGVLVVTLEEGCDAEFLPLKGPRFYELEAEAKGDAASALRAVLPAVGSEDHYRVTLTGEAEPFSADALREGFPHFPNLQLRDRTMPPLELWDDVGEDTLEGVYFGLLREALEEADEADRERIRLAARISRQLLLGQEVKLP